MLCRTVQHAVEPVAATLTGLAGSQHLQGAITTMPVSASGALHCWSCSFHAHECSVPGPVPTSLRPIDWLQARAPLGPQQPAPEQGHTARPPLSGSQPASHELSAPELGTMLMHCRSSLEVLGLVSKWAHVFDSTHASTAMHYVAYLRPDNVRPVLAHPGWDRLLQLVHSHVRHSELATWELADVVWSLAELGLQKQLLHNVLASASAQLPLFSSHDLSKIVRSLADLDGDCPWFLQDDVLPTGFLEAVEHQLPSVLVTANAQDISNFMCVFVFWNCCASQHVMDLAARRLEVVIAIAHPPSIGSAMWAFDKLAFVPPPTLVELALPRIRAYSRKAVREVGRKLSDNLAGLC